MAVLPCANGWYSTGWRRDSRVWDYFDFVEEDNKSICKVTGKECGNRFAGKFPTNLRKHLKKNHVEVFKALERKEEEKQQNEKAIEESTFSMYPIEH